MKKKLIKGCLFVGGVYLLLLTLLYFQQEKLIFHPSKTAQNYKYNFSNTYEELFFTTKDKITLHGVLFKTDSTSKGLIFYLHGNGGTIESWGDITSIYTQLGYDVFMLDYRGYGKSQGIINGEKPFLEDIQLAYNELSKQYQENRITVLGYSIGTGPAAFLASQNQPKRLILQAPYYSLQELVNRLMSFVPNAILKYKFDTASFLEKVTCPISLLHGTKDLTIPYESSVLLKEKHPNKTKLYTFPQQGHNRLHYNKEYLSCFVEIMK
jgi:pimeloyl-ACP methyl ester carboxylesterase